MFAARRALNRAAYAGEPAALRELYDRYGVRFIVVDKMANDLTASPRLYRLTTPKVQNQFMDVLAMRPDRFAGPRPG